MSSHDVTLIDPNIDPYGYLGIIKNPDGSITRTPNPTLETCPASIDDIMTILSKDIHMGRVYLPRPNPDAIPPTKLPLIVYYHGGGFIIGSASTSKFHSFCNQLANNIPAVIVSVEYRLAPEHRLPAAYDDCMEALHWIGTAGSDEWLTKYADLSKCILMGTSAGANIAYHVGLRAITCVNDLMPLKIRGMIMHRPFFGGVRRTPSEIRLADDKVFPPCVADIMWELGLPSGVDRDHEYCNPMFGIREDCLDEMKVKKWKVMVVGCDGDPMVDRQVEFTKMAKEKGVDVVGEFSEGGFHGLEIFDESKAEILFGVLKKFVISL